MTEREQFAHGYSVDCVEVYAGETSLSGLVVQTSEQRDSFRSQIQYSKKYGAEEPTPIFDIDQAIWAMWMSPTETYYAAASRVFISGTRGNFTQTKLPLQGITRIWGFSDRQIYLLGREGEVLRFDGSTWTDMSIPDGGYLYRISGVRGDELYVTGDKGGLYRYDGRTWEKIETATNVDLYGVCATDPNSVLICGKGGYAAVLESDELIRLNGDTQKDYFNVTRFKHDAYFGAGHKGVDRQSKRDIVPYKDNIFGHNLSSTESYLCACGVNEMARFDGKSWLANGFD